MGTWWITPTLRAYRGRWLTADQLAGLTLVAVGTSHYATVVDQAGCTDGWSLGIALEILRRKALLAELGANHLYTSVGEAVTALRHRP